MRVILPFLLLVWLGVPPLCQAEDAALELVRLVETDDSLCLAHGGKMVSLQLTEAALPVQEGPVEVWVDRWFMQVQTADHTRHVLTSDKPETELGCSHSIAGPQHWTLATIKRLPVAGAPYRKE